MIVPAIPRYLTPAEIAALQVGDRHHVDSGLGGSFRVEFTGQEDERYCFANVSAGWERFGPYRLTVDEVRRQVYDLIAENPFFRQVARGAAADSTAADAD